MHTGTMSLVFAVLLTLTMGTLQAAKPSAPTNDLVSALASESRPADDRKRDAGRKPAQVLEFLGIRHGMTVVDLMASGGYYTEVLSIATGPEGQVYAQNPPAFLQFRDGYYEKAISKRLSGGRLANVTRINQDIAGSGLEPGSIDAAFTALNFHDIYHRGGPEAALATAKQVYHLLKPGGIFGVIDHRGMPGNDNAALHRIEASLVRDVLEKAGFTITESDLLADADDPHDVMVFDPSIRGHTDRFLFRAAKPSMQN